MFDGADWAKRERKDREAERQAVFTAGAILILFTLALTLGIFLGQAFLYWSGRC